MEMANKYAGFILLSKEKKITPSKTFLENTFAILCYYKYSSVFVFWGAIGQTYLENSDENKSKIHRLLVYSPHLSRNTF